jgi:crossover junction endodeoxyribonuclease RusA
MTRFYVQGVPVPKQSFRYAHGGGYTDPRVTAWQDSVALVARPLFDAPLTSNLRVAMEFHLPDKRRKDLDNLAKAMDALTGIAWLDDSQVTTLVLSKVIDRANPGVWIEIEEAK